MQSRKDFIRNSLMAITATLLPEILMPVDIFDGSKTNSFLLDENGTWTTAKIVDGEYILWMGRDSYKKMNDYLGKCSVGKLVYPVRE